MVEGGWGPQGPEEKSGLKLNRSPEKLTAAKPLKKMQGI